MHASLPEQNKFEFIIYLLSKEAHQRLHVTVPTQEIKEIQKKVKWQGKDATEKQRQCQTAWKADWINILIFLKADSLMVCSIQTIIEGWSDKISLNGS